MDFEVTRRGDVRVVSLGGEVDMSSSPRARRVILDALQSPGLLVDLSRVDYIDSSGVASLVEGFQLARERGLRFGLVGVSPSALLVLRLARLDRVFPIHASLDEALVDG